jgi:dienelactone hydrolase
MQLPLLSTLILSTVLAASTVFAQAPEAATTNGDQMLANYFRAETERIAARSLAAIESPETWQNGAGALRPRLFDMFGLNPLPERGDLKPVVTGSVERDGIVVENVHFRSLPGLYVTANLYRPKEVTKPLPTVLYLCGHAGVKKGKVSFGNKCAYTHHGSWFAKNGYVCLAVDTLQLGEIEGIHHGTRRFDRWWWMCRGYTPAGVEAWNNIRALDYLETRTEVDRNRIGVTGRSGGGAYSWSLMALDDRVKAAVPVAGIVDLQSYVVDGAIEGHCDCMFFNNTYEWDYTLLATAAATRPVLLSNTDKDHIFPLDGVLRIHDSMRRAYGFNKATDSLGLQISEGPHKDIPELQVAAFRWMNRFLKNEDSPIEPATKMFTPEELQVFKELPADQLNTRIDELFVPLAELPEPSESLAAWNDQRDRWLGKLRNKCFRAWPDENDASRLPPLDVQEATSASHDGVRLRTFEFTSQQRVKLMFWLLEQADAKPSDAVVLDVLDAKRWPEFLAGMKSAFPRKFANEPQTKKQTDGAAAFTKLRERLTDGSPRIAFLAPRGIGPTAWSATGQKDVEIRRRFLLLGQTLDGMQAFDIRRACQALRSIDGLQNTPLRLEAHNQMAGNTLYASLFEPNISRLDLHGLPHSHNQGPFYLNVLRVLDISQAVAMAADRAEIHLYEDRAATNSSASNRDTAWAFAQKVQSRLGWPKARLQIHPAKQ